MIRNIGLHRRTAWKIVKQRREAKLAAILRATITYEIDRGILESVGLKLSDSTEKQFESFVREAIAKRGFEY